MPAARSRVGVIMRIGVVLRAGEGDNLVNGVVADARAATAVGIGAA